MPRSTSSPPLARSLLALGDIYLTLMWLAVKRLQHGPFWPWESPAANGNSRRRAPISFEEGERQRRDVTVIPKE